MKTTFLLACIFLLLFSCSEKKPVSDPQVLMDADRTFSNYSIQHGYQAAFIEFAHDSVVLLKDNQMPVEGKQSLIKSYEGKSDSNLSLTWEPARARIAASGEMGYTYGFWTFVAQGDTTHGTYLTVWKKDARGQWKFIADTGNEGLK